MLCNVARYDHLTPLLKPQPPLHLLPFFSSPIPFSRLPGGLLFGSVDLFPKSMLVLFLRQYPSRPCNGGGASVVWHGSIFALPQSSSSTQELEQSRRSSDLSTQHSPSTQQSERSKNACISQTRVESVSPVLLPSSNGDVNLCMGNLCVIDRIPPKFKIDAGEIPANVFKEDSTTG